VDGFEVLNRFFDHIVVITLARAVERQQRVRERLAGLRYELFLGTDKDDLDVAALERAGIYSEALARRATRHRRGLRPGEIGCSLSHRAVYQRMLSEGWRSALILEDDVVPDREALRQVGDALAQLPPGWELLYLGYQSGERTRPWDRVKQSTYLLLSALRLITWTPREVLGLHPRPFSRNLRRAGKHHCTHAYALSAAGARKLVAAQTPVAYSADQLLLKACIGRRLEAFVAEPKFFEQDSVRERTASFVAA
jgi:glycosyl transferase family 25